MKLTETDYEIICEILSLEFNRKDFELNIASESKLNDFLNILSNKTLLSPILNAQRTKEWILIKEKFLKRIYKLFEDFNSEETKSEIQELFGDITISEMSIRFDVDLSKWPASLKARVPLGSFNLENYEQKIKTDAKPPEKHEINAVVAIYLCYIDTIFKIKQKDGTLIDLKQTEIIDILLTILEYFSEKDSQYSSDLSSSPDDQLTPNSIKIKRTRFMKLRDSRPEYFENIYKFIEKRELHTRLID